MTCGFKSAPHSWHPIKLTKQAKFKLLAEGRHAMSCVIKTSLFLFNGSQSPWQQLWVILGWRWHPGWWMSLSLLRESCCCHLPVIWGGSSPGMWHSCGRRRAGDGCGDLQLAACPWSWWSWFGTPTPRKALPVLSFRTGFALLPRWSLH